MNHGFRGRFHDIRRQTHAVEAAAVVVRHDVHLAQRILTLTLGVEVIFDQLNLIAGDAVNGLINGVHRAVTVGGLSFCFITACQLHGGGCDIAGAGLHAEVIQAEMLRFFLLFINEG